MQITKFIVFSAVVATFVSADHAVPAEAIDTSKIDKLPASAVAGQNQSGEMQSLRTVDTASGKATEERVSEPNLPLNLLQKTETLLSPLRSQPNIQMGTSSNTNQRAPSSAASERKTIKVWRNQKLPETNPEVREWLKKNDGTLMLQLVLWAMRRKSLLEVQRILQDQVPHSLFRHYAKQYVVIVKHLETYVRAHFKRWLNLSLTPHQLSRMTTHIQAIDTIAMRDIIENYTKFVRFRVTLRMWKKEKKTLEDVEKILATSRKDEKPLLELAKKTYGLYLESIKTS